MKSQIKLIFEKPYPVLEVMNGMRFIFPYICLITAEKNDQTGKPDDFSLELHQIDIYTEEALLTQWNVRKWLFDKPDYYNDLYKILFYFIKQYMKRSFPNAAPPQNLKLKFLSIDFPDNLNLKINKLAHPEGAKLIIHTE